MEEGIKILEEWLAPFRELKRKGKTLIFNNVGITDKHYQQLENLLTRYKQLEEDNKRLNNHNIIGRIDAIKIEDLEPVLKPYYIPKSKVKEKIKELEREFDFYAGREHSEWQDGEFDSEVCDDIALKIGVLKELLREVI